MDTRSAPLLAVVLPAVLLAGVGGCAGYQIGNQTLYPSHIHTVYVPIFESSSFRRNLGERLTEAVAKEIELETPYKVVGDPNADSILSGTILSDTKHLGIASTNTGEARQSDFALVVKVSWRDRQGTVLRQSREIPVDDTVSVTGSSHLIPEVGQTVATAQQQAIQRVARQIVSLMEAPW